MPHIDTYDEKSTSSSVAEENKELRIIIDEGRNGKGKGKGNATITLSRATISYAWRRK